MIQQQFRTTRLASTSVALGAGAFVAMAQTADAALVAGWTMDHAITTTTTGSNYSYGAADQGALASGTNLFGSHSQANAAWTTPAGNGSPYALSSDRWSTNDYYAITFSTLGYENITLSWDQTRSSTGPSEFAIELAIGANSPGVSTGYAYSVVLAGGLGTGTNNWSTNTSQTGFTRTVSLVTLGGSGVNNAASITVKFKATGLNLGNGTNRIDNIFVNGTAIAVPAPGVLGLAGMAGLVGARRRRA